jgi:hypothetical protein
MQLKASATERRRTIKSTAENNRSHGLFRRQTYDDHLLPLAIRNLQSITARRGFLFVYLFTKNLVHGSRGASRQWRLTTNSCEGWLALDEANSVNNVCFFADLLNFE